MRRLQKILLGAFFGGVLLGGIGTGIAFVEYSSISYAGERKIGEENIETKDLDFEFDARKGIVNLQPVWYDNLVNYEVETDASVPENVIRYRVTYNAKMVTPFLRFVEEEAEEETEDFLAEDDWEAMDGPAAEQGTEAVDGQRSKVIEGPAGKKEPVREQGRLYLEARYRDDFGLWMENKDEILRDLKQGRIASYQVSDITEVRILVNPVSEVSIKMRRDY